jgi:serine/threonine-protein kinase
VAAARLVAPPPDLCDKRPEVPAAVARIIQKCMARKREDRYPSATEVATSLASMALPASEASEIGATGLPPAVRSIAPAPAPTGSQSKTVAVLPLRNAGTPEDDYLADGLTDDLIDTLSMGKDLRVRARGAVMRYKGIENDPREIGRELDVQVVADGSVRRAGEHLRVTVRLVSVEDGFQLWAKRFDRKVADVLSIGDEAANAICDALTLSWQAPARSAPTDPEAIDLYLRGRAEYHRAWRDHNEKAIELFELALARASNDPQILTGLALALCRRVSYDETASDASARALDLASRALSMSPNRPDARVAIAMVHLNEGDGEAAARELRKALALAPQSPDANDLAGRILGEVGRPEEAIERLELALAAEPERVALKHETARLLALLGRREQADRTFAVVPDDSHASLYWVARFRYVMWKRDKAEAESLLPVVSGASFESRAAAIVMFSITAYGMVPPEAIHALDGFAASGRTKRRRSFFRQLKSEVLAYVGRGEEMFTALAEAEEAGLYDVVWMDRCPLFDPYRADARFGAIRTKVAARAAGILATLLSPTR